MDMGFLTRINGFMINRNALEVNKATFQKYIIGNTIYYVLPAAETPNSQSRDQALMYIM